MHNKKLQLSRMRRAAKYLKKKKKISCVEMKRKLRKEAAWRVSLSAIGYVSPRESVKRMMSGVQLTNMSFQQKHNDLMLNEQTTCA